MRQTSKLRRSKNNFSFLASLSALENKKTGPSRFRPDKNKKEGSDIHLFITAKSETGHFLIWQQHNSIIALRVCADNIRDRHDTVGCRDDAAQIVPIGRAQIGIGLQLIFQAGQGAPIERYRAIGGGDSLEHGLNDNGDQRVAAGH
jgi:hypothetical protein